MNYMSMDTNILPYGNILSPKKLGQAVRAKRKADGLTQAKAAALCGVGIRFISDLENGKPTAELGKTLSVLAGLGLTVDVRPKGLLNQRKVKPHQSALPNKINQTSDIYRKIVSALTDSYQKSSDLSSKVFNDLSKHRKDYYSLGISMEKYNDLTRNYKQILDLNSTMLSSLNNTQKIIDKLGVSKSTIDMVLVYFNNSVIECKDVLINLKLIRTTIKNLNLNSQHINILQASYKNNLKLSKNAIHELNILKDNSSDKTTKNDK